MNKVRVRLTALAAAVLVVACTLGAGIASVHGDPLPTPTITLSGPGAVEIDTAGEMTVKVTSPTAVGETVTLEKLNGFTWAPVDTATLDSSSEALFSRTPTAAGNTQYRAKIAASGTHAAAVSATYTMVAVLPAPTVTVSNPSDIEVGTSAGLDVMVTDPTAPGEPVNLQKQGALGWGTAATQPLDASSHATFVLSPTALGSTTYRVRIAKTATHQEAFSAVFVVNTIRPIPDKSCGPAVLKADGTAWTCEYSDDFNGNALDRRFWVPQDTATSGYRTGYPTFTCYADRPDVISVHDGSLHLSMVDLGTNRSCGLLVSSRYVAGMVSHYQTFSQTYGRYEVRAKLPAIRDRGIQEAFWLWPDDPKKYGSQKEASGEIDFAEFYSRYPDHVKPYVHYISDEASNDPDHTALCAIDYDQFNTYVLEWEPGELRIHVNGSVAPCMVSHYQPTNVDSPAPFDQPFFLALTQAMGIANPALDAADNKYDTNVIPDVVTTQVDYVRIWH